MVKPENQYLLWVWYWIWWWSVRQRHILLTAHHILLDVDGKVNKKLWHWRWNIIKFTMRWWLTYLVSRVNPADIERQTSENIKIRNIVFFLEIGSLQAGSIKYMTYCDQFLFHGNSSIVKCHLELRGTSKDFHLPKHDMKISFRWN